MRLCNIKYCNFRNFKDEGQIDFSTDGKLTIIYGKNGVGKTTLHQLFYWIFYGEVHFNETAGDELYNTTLNYDANIDEEFKVWGSIDFIHNSEKFMIKREQYYRKKVSKTEKTRNSFTLLKQNSNGDWIEVAKPKEIIEELLPKGLSNYFFFDGEGMIKDLGKKGADSAKSLKEALYLLLNLTIYDKIKDLIGDKEHKNTAIGQLFKKRITSNDNSKLNEQRRNYDLVQKRIEDLEEDRNVINNNIADNENRLKEISEEIGGEKHSKKEYEGKRKLLIESRKKSEELLEVAYKDYGTTIADILPKVFMAKVIEKTSKDLKEDMEENKLIDGLDRKLIESLLNEKECICGNPLCENEKNKLISFLELLPPKRYDTLYYNFQNIADKWSHEYDEKDLKKHLLKCLKFIDEIDNIDSNIQNLDKKMAEDAEFESLIVERNNIEENQKTLLSDKISLESTLNLNRKALDKIIKEIDNICKTGQINQNISDKIDILNELKEYYSSLLEQKSKIYSRKLAEEIHSLLDIMLEAKNRNVEISENFLLKVKDQYGNEAKSEGQFATISFAYIAGIFKLLNSDTELCEKEFPLVLDAPFSKLTDESRQKVIDTVPNYAPQIIILSKDNLQNNLPNESIGKVYTITTNESFNVAKIEEGVYGI